MKLNKLLFVGALLSLGLASCNKENPEVGPNSQEEGNTYMSVSFQMPTQMRDNVDNDYNHIGQWAGRDKIEKVRVYLIDADGGITPKDIDGTTVTSAEDVHTTPAFKASAGQKTVYVVVNPNGEILTKLDAATSAADFKTAYEDAYGMLADAPANGEILKPAYATVDGQQDVIIMSGKGSILVQENVSEQDAMAGQNRVSVKVSRATARVLLTFENDINPGEEWPENGEGSVKIMGSINNNSTELGTLSELSWTVAQYEKTSFFQQKMAVDPAEGVMSPSYIYVPDNATYTTEAKKHYDYSLLSEKFVIKPFKRETGNNEANIQSIVSKNMKYITETTHKSGTLGGETSNYRRGNTTYVMVRGTFTPAVDMFASQEEAGAYDPANGLFLGLVDGKFYATLAAAQKANPVSPTAPQGTDNVIEFKAGKMFYFVWVNPDQKDNMKWYNSPVLRNNIYHINVTGFKKFGFSGNPYNPDPEDPVDPDEPTPDPDDPLNDKETYMSVEVSVIPWGMHSFDITL